MQQEEIVALIDVIEEKMMDADTLGFSPEVLAILDDVEAGNKEIEMVKFRIAPEILMKIFNVANSAYYGALRKGSIRTFYELVTRLGMSHIKALIIILAQQQLAQGDEEVEAVFAGSFASSVLGKLLALQMGIREDAAKRVELGGLFSEIGRMIMIVYKKIHAPMMIESTRRSLKNTHHTSQRESLMYSPCPITSKRWLFRRDLVWRQGILRYRALPVWQ